jgi:transcriptional regulator with XRE-family HTH domain
MTKFGQDKKPFDVLKDLAEKNKVLRKAAGLTQSEMAKRSGVSLGSLKRFELSGQISLESLLKLAQVINRIGDFELVFNENDDLKNIDKLFSDKTRN